MWIGFRILLVVEYLRLQRKENSLWQEFQSFLLQATFPHIGLFHEMFTTSEISLILFDNIKCHFFTGRQLAQNMRTLHTFHFQTQ